MKFFSFLKAFSLTRLSWTLLFGFTLFFNLCSISFQHLMKLDPCTMCIYERISMILLCLAAAVGLKNPQNGLIRWAAILGWGATSYKGMMLSIEHVHYQTSIFATCEPLYFPDWMPLDKWIPTLFAAPGDCSEIAWSFLDMSMPQWLIIIFGAYLVVWAFVVIAQFFSVEKSTSAVENH